MNIKTEVKKNGKEYCDDNVIILFNKGEHLNI